MPHKPLITDDREMKRFVTASESKAVTAEGISNTNVFTDIVENIRGAASYCVLSEEPLQKLDAWEGISAGRKMNEILKQFYKATELYRLEASESLPRALLTLRDGMIAVDKEASENLTVEKVPGGSKLEQKR